MSEIDALARQRDASSPRWARFARALTTLVVTSTTLAACLYDPDDVCGKNQVAVGDADACVCARGLVLVGSQCVPCGDNEVATETGCVCEAGYSRTSSAAPCAPILGAGAPCDTASQACEGDYSRCEAVHGTSGYCTSEGCTTADDCDDGYTCNTEQTPTFCEKAAPSGQGEPCSAPADCAGKDADFCDTFASRTCIVQNCTTAPDSCSKGWACCAIPGFMNLCLPEGACQL